MIFILFQPLLFVTLKKKQEYGYIFAFLISLCSLFLLFEGKLTSLSLSLCLFPLIWWRGKTRLQADPWRTTELDDLDSDPEDEVLESLEKPTVPINVEAYDREDSDDDE